MIHSALFLAALVCGTLLVLAGLVGPRAGQGQHLLHVGLAVLYWLLGHPWLVLLPVASVILGGASTLLGRDYLIQGTRFEAWLDRWESST